MNEDEMYEQSVQGQLQAARNDIAQLRAQLSGVGVQEFRRLESECQELRASIASLREASRRYVSWYDHGTPRDREFRDAIAASERKP